MKTKKLLGLISAMLFGTALGIRSLIVYCSPTSSPVSIQHDRSHLELLLFAITFKGGHDVDEFLLAMNYVNSTNCAGKYRFRSAKLI